jgi:hypothetical protein
MREKIPALIAAIALGTATMTTGAMAFGHGGGGGHLGGGAQFCWRSPYGRHRRRSCRRRHLCQRRTFNGGHWRGGYGGYGGYGYGAQGLGLGLGLGLGGLYADADNPYCGYRYYDCDYAYCGPYDYG